MASPEDSLSMPANLRKGERNNTANGAYANMAAKYSCQCKRPPEMGFPRFLLAHFLKVNEPWRHFSLGILHKRY